MRIGIDARFYGPKHAGLGRYTKNLIDQLAKLDTQDEFVIFMHHSTINDFATTNPRFSKQTLAAEHYSLAEQIALPKVLAAAKVDLMHFPHLNVPISYNGPYVVTIHDLIMHKFKNRAVTTKVKPVYELKHLGYRFVTRWAAQHSQAIIAPSKAVKDELVDFYHLPPHKVTVTYEAADDMTFKHTDQSAVMAVLDKYAITKPFIMYVGNVYPHKNIELLAKALPQLFQRYGIQLVLPSARSIFLQRTEQMMIDHGVREHVVLPGYVPDQDLQALYASAEAYVFPSLAEGFGLPPLEAMMAGLPVICSDIPVLHEVCDQAALYIDPHNSQTVVDQVSTLMDNPALRTTMIQRGQAQAALFSWQSMAKQTLSVYHKVGQQTKQT